MSIWSQLGFQDAASSIIYLLIKFHDHCILILTLISVLIVYSIVSLLFNSYICNNIYEAQEIETIWTIVPAFILLFLAFPSLRLLYLMDELAHPSITVKVLGHQWYWSYEYGDFFDLEFDSYIIPTSELNFGDYRLLEVDHRTVLPLKVEIRLLVSSADVIHAWTVPCIGVKVDAVPGRLNSLGIICNRPGIFYGQCSEICGANHSFIPISLEVVSVNSFISWLKLSSDS